MIFHYLKIGLRSLLRFKGFATINITGLALGITSGLLIMLYVTDELSFDRFHLKSNRIYRVTTTFNEGVNETNGWPVGNILRNEFPEVEAVLYTRNASYLVINFGDKKIRQKIHFASPEFFEIFSFPLLQGDAKTALTNPFSLVISEEMEKKYFPAGSALGQTITMNDTLLFTITGIMKNFPANSHIQADVLASFSSYEKIEPYFSYTEGWGNINMRNYILLKEGVDVQAFREKAKDLYMQRAGDLMKNWGVEAHVEFEPLEDIYLRSKAGNGMGPIGSIDRVYMLCGVSAFVILLACINFINLTTAKSAYRAKEVGLRKVVGSTRGAIIKQFLGESFVITVIAILVALAITGLLLPHFNQLLGKHYVMADFIRPVMVIGSVVLTIIISLLSGYYPAWVISKLKPAEILKGKLQGGTRGLHLRRALVVFQFIISVSLVAGTLVILQQLRFMQNKDLGFTKEEVLVLNVAQITNETTPRFQTFLNSLRQFAAVKQVTFCNAVPGLPGWIGQIAYPEGKTGEHTVDTEYLAVDENYLNTLNLTLLAGKNFDLNHSIDLQEGLLINERSVIDFGWQTPEQAIGKRITSPSGTPEGRVIGVIKDYHETGLQQPIGPMVMDYNPDAAYLYAIRYAAANTQELINGIGQLWKESFPGYEFSYFFLNEKFEQQYQSEKRLSNVFFIFSTITIVIAFIGLYGMLSFIIVTKTKEIGIRKVLGATIVQITKLLSYEFILLVGIASIIAVPVTWYAAANWLQRFAYRIQVSPIVFIITALFAIILTLLTVGIQAIRAASANPVESLRTE